MNRRLGIHSLWIGLIVMAMCLCSCATSPSQSDLDSARALMKMENWEGAFERLQQATEKHPGDVNIRIAFNEVRAKYGDALSKQADTAYQEGKQDEAGRLYTRLGTVPGYEYRSQRGLDSLKAQKTSGSCPPPDPGKLVSVCHPYSAGEGKFSGEGKTIRSETILPAQHGDSKTATKHAAALPEAVAAAEEGVKAGESEKSSPKDVEAGKALPAHNESAGKQSEKSGGKTELLAKSRTGEEEGPLDRLVTLEFRDASIRSLFDVITQASGLNVVFDRDISPGLKTTVFLRNTTIRSALDKIVMTTGLAWREMDDRTLLVYNDETEKQRDYQELTVRGFQLTNADAKSVAKSMKTVLKFKDMMVDEKLNMIVVRDTPKALALADKLVAMLDVPVPEVMLDVAVLEINRDKAKSLGVTWPTSMTLSPLARSSTTTSDGATTSTLTLRDLWNLTPGSMEMSISSGSVDASVTDSDAKLLANPRIRVRNREKAKILIGERVPNISATTTSTGTVSDSITYVDVGLKLDVEPQIYPGNEIGLSIALEVSSINSTLTTDSGVTAYRIGTRNASTVLRVKDGENQVLGGLIQDEDKKSASKVPLLGDIPLLGHLFRSDTTEKDKTEIVLSITPHLVRKNDYLPHDVSTFKAGTITSVRGHRKDDEASGAGVPSDDAADDEAARSSSKRQGGNRDKEKEKD